MLNANNQYVFLFQCNQDALENIFSLLRACFGGNDTKPTPMQVCQGLKIIMLTRMDNLGALLCDGAPVMFQDSSETEMGEKFISSGMINYKEVQVEIREADKEVDDFVENYQDKEVDDFVKNQDNISLDETELDPHTEEYIGGFVSKKV